MSRLTSLKMLRAQATRGFTLIELLVVMSLLSIIMVGLVSALRTMAQTESKIDQRLARLDEVRVARHFLQQTLSRVSAMSIDEPGATGKKMVPFVATPQRVTWVGVMPARPNIGGRYHFQLSVEDASAGRELILRFLPWVPDGVTPDWTRAESRVLVKDIQNALVQADGQPPVGRNPSEPWPKGWQDGWPVADVLPERLRLQLTDVKGDLPPWTIALRALPQSDSSFSTVVVGGSR